jgi:hypothetical protein
MNCRDNNSKKLSGGLATFIKRNIVHGIQLIDKSVKMSPDWLYFEISLSSFSKIILSQLVFNVYEEFFGEI